MNEGERDNTNIYNLVESPASQGGQIQLNPAAILFLLLLLFEKCIFSS